jgi:hypothetical protein
MKKLFVLAAIILSYNIAVSQEEPFNAAVKQKMISYIATGNSKSTHFLKPLVLKLTNLLNTPKTIKIDNGQIFVAGDSAYQNLVVTNELIVTIPPKGNKSVELYAMCIEKHDSAPVDNVIYREGKMAGPSLKGLTMIIQKKKYFDQIGQEAVWCIENNSPVENIAGFNKDEVLELQKYVCSVTGKKMPPPPAPDDYLHNYNYSNFKRTIGGFFEFDFNKKSDVKVAMFNSRGIVMRELYNQTNVSPGNHKIKFEFDGSAFENGTYTIKLIVDGEVFYKKELELKEPHRD